MKYILFPQPLLLSAALFVAAVGSQIAQATTIQFESAGDLSNFNQVVSAGAPVSTFADSATAGTGGTGGLIYGTTPADTTAVYSAQSFDLTTGVEHTVSIDFQVGDVPSGSFSGGANAVVMVGFSGSSDRGFYSDATESYIGGRLRHRSSGGGADGLQSQTKALNGGPVAFPADGALADIDFVSFNWYRLSLSVIRDAVQDQFSYDMTLELLGATGTETPLSVGNIVGTFTNASLYNDTEVYAAFRGVPAVANSNVAFDNFTVTSAIPEPASASLLGLSVLGLLATRRRRH